MSEENEGIIATLTKTIENNWRLLLVGVIILAIALNSSWSDNKSASENDGGPTPTPTPQSEQTQETEQNKPEENKQTAENNANNAAQAKEPEITNADANTNIITQIAAKSEGVTHLARRAVKEYLRTAQESLSAEQKIYAEDYLKRKIGTRKLAVGEKVEFSNDLIKQSVEKAKGLNENQIKNLSKYVPLIKNLN